MKGVRKTSVIGSQDGQEKNENEGPILGDKSEGVFFSADFAPFSHHKFIYDFTTILYESDKKRRRRILPGTVREGRFPVFLTGYG